MLLANDRLANHSAYRRLVLIDGYKPITLTVSVATVTIYRVKRLGPLSKSYWPIITNCQYRARFLCLGYKNLITT